MGGQLSNETVEKSLVEPFKDTSEAAETVAFFANKAEHTYQTDATVTAVADLELDLFGMDPFVRRRPGLLKNDDTPGTEELVGDGSKEELSWEYDELTEDDDDDDLMSPLLSSGDDSWILIEEDEADTTGDKAVNDNQDMVKATAVTAAAGDRHIKLNIEDYEDIRTTEKKHFEVEKNDYPCLKSYFF